MKYTYCLIVSLCLWVNMVSAQKIRLLSIGDPMPDISLRQVLNAPFSSSRLSNFKNKVIILDFFATWCSSCIKALPHLDSLQRKMPDQLQVFVVDATEDKATVERFLKTNPVLKTISLPIVTGDTSLKALFPHTFIPHEIWLYNGVFKAVTRPGDITVQNIRSLLSGGSIPSTKFDALGHDALDMKKPLPVSAGTPLLYHSLFTGNIEGLGSGTYLTKQGRDSATRITYRNTPLAAICKQAYELTAVPANRFFYEDGTDSVLQQTGDWDSWSLKHTYCYEMVMPPAPIGQLRRAVREDIARTFGITITKARRKLSCWVLQWVGTNLPVAGQAKPGNNLYENTDSLLFLHHQPISPLIGYLNSISTLPVLDETNISAKLYMDFTIQKRTDIHAWQELLRSFGFVLKQEEREIDTYHYSRLP
ncbi:MAG: TlpA disulfide reductase family protein [Bacteroidota bacterium]